MLGRLALNSVGLCYCWETNSQDSCSTLLSLPLFSICHCTSPAANVYLCGNVFWCECTISLRKSLSVESVEAVIVNVLCPWCRSQVKVRLDVFLKRPGLDANQFPPTELITWCDWRRWGVAFAIAVISVRCLLGLRSGNAFPCGCRCCGGALLRTGQLSPRLTRRLWRTLLWHQWLIGTPYSWICEISPFVAVPALLGRPRSSRCFHTSRPRCTDGRGRRNPSHFLWHLLSWGWRHSSLIITADIHQWNTRHKKREQGSQYIIVSN